MAEALGAIRVDLSANLSEFTKNIKQAVNTVEGFGKAAGTVVQRMDAAFQQMGSKLTLKVTAPLVGLAVAAVKAADPAKKMGQEMERAGLRMQKALEPLGKVLIDNLQRLKPSIDAMIDTVNGLSRQFAALSPETQQNVLQFAALAAAAGPALLAMSALTTVAKSAMIAFGGLYTIGKFLPGLFVELGAKSGTTTTKIEGVKKAATQLTLTLGLLAKSLSVVGTFALGISYGGWIYDSVKQVQQAMSVLIHTTSNLWQDFETQGKAAFVAIEVAFKRMINALVPSPQLTGFLSGVLNTASPGAGHTLQALVSTGRVAVPDLQSELQRLSAENAMGKALNAEALAVELRDIENRFQRGAFNPTGDLRLDAEDPFSRMVDGAKTFKAELAGIIDDITEVGTSARAAGAGASSAAVQTADELKKAAELTAQLKQDMEKAKELRFSAYPREKLAEDIKNIKELAIRFPQILSPDVVKITIEKMTEQLKKLEEKADDTFGRRMSDSIKGFSSNVSDAFADLVVDGEAAFDQLAKSFAKMITSMIAKQYIFGPILEAIGGVAGKAFGAPGGTSKSTVPVVHGEYGAGQTFGSVDLSSLGRGGGGGYGTVNIYNQSGVDVETRQRQGPGGTILDIIVPGMQAAFAQGRMDKTMKNLYGVDRTARY